MSTLFSSSSSSSHSSSSAPSASSSAYLNASSVRTEVKAWRNGLVAAAASNRTITWINHRKLETGVNHEYLLFGVGNALFVTERNNEDPPDYRITNGKIANNLLTTLAPVAAHALPERTFARILALVSEKVPNYYALANNCFWYAGSVCETIRVGLPQVNEERTYLYKKRGKVTKGWFAIPVGSAPSKIFKSLCLTLD